MQNWMDNLPRGQLFKTGMLFGGGDSGGGGGGGTQTTTGSTQAQHLPWQSYVPYETHETYKKGLKYAADQVGQGLSPQQLQQYKGNVLTTTGQQFAGSAKDLREQLARSGVKGGAVAESFGDLARSKMLATATGLSGITEQDILEKRRNLEEARRWVGVPGSPIQTGSSSTNTTTQQPTGGGGGS